MARLYTIDCYVVILVTMAQEYPHDYYMYIKDTGGTWYTIVFTATQGSPSDNDIVTMIAYGFAHAIPVANPGSTVDLTNGIADPVVAESKWFKIVTSVSFGCYYPVVDKASLANLDNFPVHTGTLCGFIPSSDTDYNFLNHFTFGTDTVASPLQTVVDTVHHCFRTGYTGIYGDKAAYTSSSPSSDAVSWLYLNRGYDITRATLSVNLVDTHFYNGLYDYLVVNDDTVSGGLGLISDPTGGAYRFTEANHRFVVLTNLALRAAGSTRVIVVAINGNNYELGFTNTSKATVQNYTKLVNPDFTNVRRGIQCYTMNNMKLFNAEPGLSNGKYFIGMSSTGIHWWSGPVYGSSGFTKPYDCQEFARFTMVQAQYCFPVTFVAGTPCNFTWGITDVTFENNNQFSIGITTMNYFKFFWSYPYVQLTNAEFETYYGPITDNFLLFNGAEESDYYYGVYYNIPKDEDTANNWHMGSVAFIVPNANNPGTLNYTSKIIERHGNNYYDKFNNDIYTGAFTYNNQALPVLMMRWVSGSITIGSGSDAISYNYDERKMSSDACMIHPGLLARSIAYHYYTTDPTNFKQVYVTNSRHPSYCVWTATIQCENPFTISQVKTPNGNYMLSQIQPGTSTSLSLTWNTYTGTQIPMLLKYNTSVNDTSVSTVAMVNIIDNYSLPNVVDAIHFAQVCDTRYPSAAIPSLVSYTIESTRFNLVFNSGVTPVYSLSATPGALRYLTLTNNQFGTDAAYSNNLFQINYKDIADTEATPGSLTIVNPGYQGVWLSDTEFVPLFSNSSAIDSNRYHTHVQGLNDSNGYLCFANGNPCVYLKPSTWTLNYKFNAEGVSSDPVTMATPLQRGFHTLAHTVQTLARSMSCGLLRTLGAELCNTLGLTIGSSTDLTSSNLGTLFPVTRFTLGQTTATVAMKLSTPGWTACYPLLMLQTGLPSSYFNDWTSTQFSIQGVTFASNVDTLANQLGGTVILKSSKGNLYRMFLPNQGVYQGSGIRNMAMDYLAQASNMALINLSTGAIASDLVCLGVTKSESCANFLFNQCVTSVYTVPTQVVTDATIAALFSTSVFEFNTSVQGYNYCFQGYDHVVNKIYHVYTEDYSLASATTNCISVYIDPGYGCFSSNKVYHPVFNSDYSIVDPLQTKACQASHVYYLYNSGSTGVETVRYPLNVSCNTLVINVNSVNTVLTVREGSYSWDEFVTELKYTLGSAIGYTGVTQSETSVLFTGTKTWYYNRSDSRSTIQNYYWTRLYNMVPSVQSMYLERADTGVLNMGYDCQDSFMTEEPVFACVADLATVDTPSSNSYTFSEPLILDFIYSGSTNLRIQVAPGVYTAKTLDNTVATAFNTAIGTSYMVSVDTGDSVYISSSGESGIVINSVTSPNFPQTMFNLVQQAGYTDLYPQPVYPIVYKSIPRYDSNSKQIPTTKWDPSVPVPTTVQTTSITGEGLYNKVVQLCCNCGIGLTRWSSTDHGLDITMSKNVQFDFRNGSNQVITPGFVNTIVTKDSTTGANRVTLRSACTQVLGTATIMYTLAGVTTTMNLNETGYHTQASLVGVLNATFASNHLNLEFTKGATGYTLDIGFGTLSGTLLTSSFFGINGMTKSGTVYTWVYTESVNGVTKMNGRELGVTPVHELDRYLCLVDTSTNTCKTKVKQSDNTSVDLVATLVPGAYTVQDLVRYVTRVQSYQTFVENRAAFGSGWYNLSQADYIDSYAWSITSGVSWSALCFTEDSNTNTVLTQVPFTKVATSATPVATLSTGYSIYAQSSNYYMYIRNQLNEYYSVFFIPTQFEATCDDNHMAMLEHGFRQVVPSSSSSTSEDLFQSVTVNSAMFSIGLKQVIGCYYPIGVTINNANAAAKFMQNFIEHQGTLCGFVSSNNTGFHWLNHFTFGDAGSAGYNVKAYVSSTQYCFKDPYDGVYGSNAALYNGTMTDSATNFQYINRGYNIFRVQLPANNNSWYYYNQYDYSPVATFDHNTVTDYTRGAYTFDEGAYRFLALCNIYMQNAASSSRLVGSGEAEGNCVLLIYSTQDKQTTTPFNELDNANYTDCFRHACAYRHPSDLRHRLRINTEPNYTGEPRYFIGEAQDGTKWWSGPVYDMPYKYILAATRRWTIAQVSHCFPLDFTPGTPSNFNWGVTNVTVNDVGDSNVVTFTNPFKLYWSYPLTTMTSTQASVYYGSTLDYLLFNGAEYTNDFACAYYSAPGLEDSCSNYFTSKITFRRASPDDPCIMNFDTKQCLKFNDVAKDIVIASNLVTIVNNEGKLRYYQRWNSGSAVINGNTIAYPFNKYYLLDSIFPSIFMRMIAQDTLGTPIATTSYEPYAMTSYTKGYNSWHIVATGAQEFTIDSLSNTTNVPFVKAIVAPVTTDTLDLSWSVYTGTSTWLLLSYTTVNNAQRIDTLNYTSLLDSWTMSNLVEAMEYLTVCDTRPVAAGASTLKLLTATSSASAINLVFDSACTPVYTLSRNPGVFQYTSLSTSVFGTGADFSSNLFNMRYTDLANGDTGSTLVQVVNPAYLGAFGNNKYTAVYNGSSYVYTGFHCDPQFQVHNNSSTVCFVDNVPHVFYPGKGYERATMVYQMNGVSSSKSIQVPRGIFRVDTALNLVAMVAMLPAITNYGITECVNRGIQCTTSVNLYTQSYPFTESTLVFNQTTPGSVSVKLGSVNGTFLGNNVYLGYLKDQIPATYFTGYNSSFNLIGYHMGSVMTSSDTSAITQGGYLYLSTGESMYRLFVPLKNTSTTTIDYIVQASKAPVQHVTSSGVTIDSGIKVLDYASTDSSITLFFDRNIVGIQSIPTSAISDTNIASIMANTVLWSQQQAVGGTNYTYLIPGYDTGILKSTQRLCHWYTESITQANPVTNRVTLYLTPNFGIFDTTSNHEFIPLFNSNSVILDSTVVTNVPNVNYLYYHKVNTRSTLVTRYPLDSNCNTLVLNIGDTSSEFKISSGLYTWPEFVDTVYATVKDAIIATSIESTYNGVTFVSTQGYTIARDSPLCTLNNYYWTRYLTMSSTPSAWFENPDPESPVANSGYIRNPAFTPESGLFVYFTPDTIVDSKDYEFYQGSSVVNFSITDSTSVYTGSYTITARATTPTSIMSLLCSAMNYEYFIQTYITDKPVVTIDYNDPSTGLVCPAIARNQGAISFEISPDSNFKLVLATLGEPKYQYHVNLGAQSSKDFETFDVNILEPVDITLYICNQIGVTPSSITDPNVVSTSYTLVGKLSRIELLNSIPVHAEKVIRTFAYNTDGAYFSANYAFRVVTQDSLISYMIRTPSFTTSFTLVQHPCYEYLNLESPLRLWDTRINVPSSTQVKPLGGTGVFNRITQLLQGYTSSWDSSFKVILSQRGTLGFGTPVELGVTPSFTSLVTIVALGDTQVSMTYNGWTLTRPQKTIVYTSANAQVKTMTLSSASNATQATTVRDINNLFKANSLDMAFTVASTGYTIAYPGTLGGTFWSLGSNFFNIGVPSGNEYTWAYNDTLGATKCEASSTIEEIPEEQKYINLVNSTSRNFNDILVSKTGTNLTYNDRVVNGAYRLLDFMHVYTMYHSHALASNSRSTFVQDSAWYNVTQSNTLDNYYWEVTGNAAWDKLCFTNGMDSNTILKHVQFKGFTTRFDPIATVSNRYSVYAPSSTYYMYIRDTSAKWYTIVFLPYAYLDDQDANAVKLLKLGFSNAIPVAAPNTTENLFSGVVYDSCKYTINLVRNFGCYYPVVQYNLLSNLDHFPTRAGTLCGFISSANTSFHYLNHFTFGTIDMPCPVSTVIESTLYCFKDPYTGIYGSNAAYYGSEPTSNTSDLAYFNRGFDIKRVAMNSINFYMGMYIYKGTYSSNSTDRLYSYLEDTTRDSFRYDEMANRSYVLMNIVSQKNNIDRIFVRHTYDDDTLGYLKVYRTTSSRTEVTEQSMLNTNDLDNVHQLLNSYYYPYPYIAFEPHMSSRDGYLIGVTEAGVHWWSGPYRTVLTGFGDLQYSYTMQYVLTQCQYCFAVNDYTPGDDPLFKWNITSVTYGNYGSNHWSIRAQIQNPVKLYWSYPSVNLTDAEFASYYGTLTSSWLVCNGIEYTNEPGSSIWNKKIDGVYLNEPKVEDSVNDFYRNEIYFMNVHNDEYYFYMNRDEHRIINVQGGYSPYIREQINCDTHIIVESSTNAVAKVYQRWYNGSLTVNGSAFKNIACPYFVRDTVFPMFVSRIIAQATSTRATMVAAHNVANVWTTVIEAPTQFTISAKTVTSGNPLINAISTPVTTSSLNLTYNIFGTNNTFALIRYTTSVSGSPIATLNYTPVVDTWRFTCVLDAFNHLQLCDNRAEYSNASVLSVTRATQSNSGFEFVFNSGVYPVFSLSYDPREFKYTTLDLNQYGHCIAYSHYLFHAHFVDIADTSSLTAQSSVLIVNRDRTVLFSDADNSALVIADGSGIPVHTYKWSMIYQPRWWDAFVNHKLYTYPYCENNGTNNKIWQLKYKFNVTGVTTDEIIVDTPNNHFYTSYEDTLKMIARSMSMGALYTLGPAQCATLGIHIDYTGDLLSSTWIHFPDIHSSFTIRQNSVTSDSMKIKLSSDFYILSHMFLYINSGIPSMYFNNYCSSFDNIRGTLTDCSNNYVYDSYLYFTTDRTDYTKYYKLYLPISKLYDSSTYAINMIADVTIEVLLLTSNSALYRACDNTLVASSELCITGCTSTASSVRYIFNHNVVPVFSIPTEFVPDSNVAGIFANNIVDSTLTIRIPNSPSDYTASYTIAGFEQAKARYNQINSCVFHIYAENVNQANPVSNSVTIYKDPRYGVFDSSRNFVPLFNRNFTVVDASKTTLVSSNNRYLYQTTSLPSSTHGIARFNLNSTNNTMALVIDQKHCAISIPSGDYTWSEFEYTLQTTLESVLGPLTRSETMDTVSYTSQEYSWYFDRASTRNTVQNYYWTKGYTSVPSVQSTMVPKPDTRVYTSDYNGNDCFDIVPGLFASVADTEQTINTNDYWFYQPATTINYRITNDYDPSVLVSGSFVIGPCYLYPEELVHIMSDYLNSVYYIPEEYFYYFWYDAGPYASIADKYKYDARFTLTFDSNFLFETQYFEWGEHNSEYRIWTSRRTVHTTPTWPIPVNTSVKYSVKYTTPDDTQVHTTSFTTPSSGYNPRTYATAFVNACNTALESSVLSVQDLNVLTIVTTTGYTIQALSLGYPQIFDLVQNTEQSTLVPINSVYRSFNPWNQVPQRFVDMFVPIPNTVQTTSIKGSGFVNNVVQSVYNITSLVPVTNWYYSSSTIIVNTSKNASFRFFTRVDTPLTTPHPWITQDTTNAKKLTFTKLGYTQSRPVSTIVYTKNSVTTTLNLGSSSAATQQQTVTECNTLFNSLGLKWELDTTGYRLDLNQGTLGGTFFTTSFFDVNKASATSSQGYYLWKYQTFPSAHTSSQSATIVNDNRVIVVNSNAAQFLATITTPSTTVYNDRVEYGVYKEQDLVKVYSRIQSYKLHKVNSSAYSVNQAWFNVADD